MKACSSERSKSLLSWPNASRTSESSGSLDKTPSSRFRTTPGFAGPAGTFFSADSEMEESATESASSGVGRFGVGRLGAGRLGVGRLGVGRLGAWADDRGRTCLWGGGSFDDRDLLDPAMLEA